MYILAGLQPSEDATGGAWFTDGVLDQELLEMLAMALERRISERSWKQVTDWGDASVGLQPGVSRKRKEPHDGLESIKGKEKMPRTNAEDGGDAVLGSSDMEKESHHGLSPPNPQTSTKRPKKVYIPYPAGYQKYSTLPELTSFVNDHNIVQSGKIPENNISQLLDVMVYDDRIHKINSSSDGSTPTMYRAWKTVAQINADSARDERMRDKTIGEARQIKAIREAEIKKLGNGGITEIPCGRCPVFDMCEVGGPVNPNNCEYFEEWFAKLESHQRDGEDILTW
jgi:DNA-directed RNA polymerase III subunit RPC6